MKNLLVFLSLLILVSISCQNNKDQNPERTAPKKTDKYTSKFYPRHLHDLERAYPDTVINIKGHKRGRKQVQENIAALNNLRNGFSLPWTIQGPSNLGARINCVAVDSENDRIMYAGFAGGGLWRTLDNGRNWTAIFEEEIHNSISDIAVDEKNPGTIYIGTGDPNIPFRAYIGSGLYKSEDYGDTWTHLGLEKQSVISQIRLHPDDANTIYVASMGLPYEIENESRGLFRSVDGGENWERIFNGGEETGVSDFIINPEQPEYLYVATWDRIASASINFAVGEGSGIYISDNSGETWSPAVGIPDTILSRTGLAICTGSPNNVYAVTVDTTYEVGGIYRSQDYGLNFEELPTDSLWFEDWEGEMTTTFYGFGWYFGKIAVNPTNPDHIYVLGVDLIETYDAGKDWEMASTPWWWYDVHADKHELLIDESGGLILATDGGLYRGEIGDMYGWEDIEDIPTTQFYRVGYNPHRPDLYYGGAQDNGTTAGNISNINEWPRLIGGDGFQTIFDPVDPNHWFGEVQRGSIRMTLDDGAFFENITEEFDGNSAWDTPYFLSPHDRNVLYMARDTIFKSESSYNPEWVAISDDLIGGRTTALDESPLVEGRLYAGTSRGRLYLYLSGTSWIGIGDNLPERYVTSIKASPSYEDYVYVTLSGYTANDFTSRVYRSENVGFDWTDIGQGLPDVPVNDILILPGFSDRIMFIATDGGIYATLNYGDDWTRVGNNMPNIICYDLEYNVANEELVVATFGRGIMSYPITELLAPVSTSELVETDLDLNVFPNPAQDYIQISSETILKGDYKVEVLDNIGRKKVDTQNSNKIDISQLISGQYYLILKTEDRVLSTAFVKS